MSGLNISQIYALNPITTNSDTDLMYFEKAGLDAAMQVQNFVAKNATNAINGGTVSSSTNAEFYPLFAASTTNSNQPFNLNSGLHYNPSTHVLTTTTFNGALTGNASTATNVAVGGITGLGTGVATALAINVGSAGAFITFNGAGGTPSSMVGTNITGTAAGLTAGNASAVAVSGITGLGTGVATALAINVGSAGAFITNGGALGTPSSGVATNLTGTASGLTAGTASAVAVGGITGLGTGVATALAINVGTSGAFVTKNGALGTPSSGTLTNCSGYPVFSSQNVVTGSRALNTVYQNTTGKTMFVSVSVDNQGGGVGTTTILTDSSNPPTTEVAKVSHAPITIAPNAAITFMVLNNNYYKVSTNVAGLDDWVEWY